MYMYVTMCMYVYVVMYTHFPQIFSEFNCILEKEITKDIREIWLEVIPLDITKFELSPKLKSLYEEGTTCTSEGIVIHTIYIAIELPGTLKMGTIACEVTAI